uniref:uncharacterized protein LOC122607342 isoform X2 n=1 Tax=Erigeron canadensis TaxID=72917 RepID=UPI001CB8E488|nr:uncharacterized protein LOC122607342 isoform X2 [Erigeron canadensis]
MSAPRRWEHLKMPFEQIKAATNDFSICIGSGGYGRVYKGHLSISGKLTTVAVKRLNEHLGQGLREFLTELELLSGQNHENVISLLAYCDEGKEKIIVYEYAERGSFDKYIRRTSDDKSTWLERLKICADAAHGLDHLHSHFGEHQAIIHRDIKSANILINDKGVAKVSDLGLSKLSLAGLDRSAVISNACGTPGYVEPEYINTGVVTKQSDVYSFGMVLFEALSGRLCSLKEDDGFLLSGKLAKDYYKENKLDEIVDPGLTEQMSLYSMRKFAAIAYRCLHDVRERRPSMDVVKKELEDTLKIQVEFEHNKKNKKSSKGQDAPKPDSYWETKLPGDWKVIIKMLDLSEARYSSIKKLFFLLHRGILFDEGNKVLWINDEEKRCLLISARSFLTMGIPNYPRWVSHCYLRFSTVAEYSFKEFHDIKCQIKTNVLSLGTMYAASLIFKYREQSIRDLERLKLITIRWKMGELTVCSTHTAELVVNNWYKIKMWYFINHGPSAEFDFVIKELSYFEDPMESELLIQGIEFYPIEMQEETEKFTSLSVSHEDEYWGEKLPNDYQNYIQRSDKPLHYTNKKELYACFCDGFLGDNGQLWFSLCKSTGGICSMIPATSTLPDNCNYKRLDTISLSTSRFGKVKKLQEAYWYSFECKLQARMFSPQYKYACYLVFKFEDNHSEPDDTCFFKAWYNLDDTFGDTFYAHFKLSSMNIPTIESKNSYGSDDLSKISTTERWISKCDTEFVADSRMKERGDGWMEVMLCKPAEQLQNGTSLRLTLSKFKGGSFSGILVEGLEFRPTLE